MDNPIKVAVAGAAGRMGRTGIAMTLVTDRDLRDLKSLLNSNGIEPTWRGREPDLSRAGSGRRRRGRPRPKGKSAGRVEHHGPPHHREHRGRRR